MKATPPTLLAALKFASEKHRQQRRKDLDATPYINHPIAVAEVLERTGGVTDLPTFQAEESLSCSLNGNLLPRLHRSPISRDR